MRRNDQNPREIAKQTKNHETFACFVYFRMFRDLSWILVIVAHE